MPNELVFETEAKFRKAAQKELEEAGFVVKAISINKRLPKQMKGLADFEVRHPDWERGRWSKVEVKNGNEPFSDTEQEASYLRGEIEVFRWISDVQEFIRRN